MKTTTTSAATLTSQSALTSAVAGAWETVGQNFDQFCLLAGFSAPGEMMEADVTALAGEAHARDTDKPGYRWGRTRRLLAAFPDCRRASRTSAVSIGHQNDILVHNRRNHLSQGIGVDRGQNRTDCRAAAISDNQDRNLFIFGTGGIVGNILATRLTGRFGPDRIITFSLSSLGMICAVLALWASPLIPAMGLFIVWAICGMMLYVPQQTRLIALKPQAQNLILALNAAALYVGMAGGSAVAGFLTTRYGTEVLPLGSLLLVLVALAAFWLSWRQARSTLSGEAA